MTHFQDEVLNNAILRTKQFWHADKWHDHVDVTFEQGKVTSIEPTSSAQPKTKMPFLDYSDLIVAPAPIDCQVNGGGGILFNDDPSPSGLATITKAHLDEGTGLIFPTLFSPTYEQAVEAITSVNKALEEGWPGIGGLHLEGPFLNPVKAGAHDPSTIIPIKPDDKWLNLIASLHKKGRLIVTLAPEIVGLDIIKHLAAQDIIVLLGHAQPSFDEAMAAFDAGARGVTHLFNAMDGWIARKPGLAGATLLHPHAYCNIIMDGHHLHPMTWEMIKKVKPHNKIIWVSDATTPVGTDQKSFYFGKDKVFVKDKGCYREDGSLAGSTKSLYEIMMSSSSKNKKEHLSYSVINPLALLKPQVTLRYMCY